MIFIILGVTGSGKTTVGSLLAQRLQLPFVDADDYHPPANIEKMKSGIPLEDEDRHPWLERLNRILVAHHESGLVLACSALKEKYRQQLHEGLPAEPHWYYLEADAATLQKRLAARRDHFMPPALLTSQLESFEQPPYARVIDGRRSPEAIVEAIIQECAH